MNQPDIEDLRWAARHPKLFKQFVTAAVIFFATLAAVILLWPERGETAPVAQPVVVKAKQAIQVPKPSPSPKSEAYVAPTGEVKALGVPNDSYTMHSTAFSSSECGTPYCRAQVGKPRQYVVALNKKFGKAKAVFVPAYGREYLVIGTTDQNTDLDFFMDSLEAAKEFGTKNLLINVIR